MSQATMGHLRNDIKRSESVLSRLEKVGLTEAGKEWIIAAFDPFHDREVNCTGLPDANQSDSMVQVITLSAQVVGPSTTNPWSCHIVDWPFLGDLTVGSQVCPYTNPGNQFNVPNNAFITGAQNNKISTNWGGLGIATFNQSDNTVNVFNSTGTGVQTYQNLKPTVNDLTNPYRVIGKGWEVYNTSPDLYKSGAVCIYKQSLPDYTSATAATIISGAPLTLGILGSFDTLMMESPPQSVNEALRLPNARQWDAEQGCYVISPLHRHDVPVHLANWTQPVYYDTNPGDLTLHGQVMAPYGTGGSTPYDPQILVGPDQNFMNFDQTGAIFTGLTPQSTLTVNYRLYIEVFPTASNSLSNFSKPSPMYDPIALDLYSQISWKAPIGVEVKYNGLGDWFMDGIRSVSEALGPASKALAKVIPHKGLQAASMAMDAINKSNKPKHGLGKISGREIQGPLPRLQQEVRDVERNLKKLKIKNKKKQK